MWHISHIKWINSPAEIRRRTTQANPCFYQKQGDLTRMPPWLKHGVERQDRGRTRIGVIRRKDGLMLKPRLQIMFEEHGPFLAARNSEGHTVCWAPGWKTPEA